MRRRARCLLTFGACLALAGGSTVRAADAVSIQKAIEKGAVWLQQNFNSISSSGENGLATLAIVKANVPTNSPAITGGVQRIVEKCKTGEYVPPTNHIYEAGVDINVLADVDSQQYLPQIQMIADYLLAQQLPNGGWDYPTGRQGHGDTSVTQYALLGLWAASRAGVEIPPTAWDQALAWHIASQNQDGGFPYVPGTQDGYDHGGSSLNLTLACLGSMLIAARHNYPGRADSLAQLLDLKEDRAAARQQNRFGVLEAVDLSKTPEAIAASAGPARPTADITRVKQAVQRAYGWCVPRAGPTSAFYPHYYYYTLERAGSLADVKQFGRFDWYETCADDLLSKQKPDGSWTITTHAYQDVSFVVLFLSRSTGKLLRRTIAPDPVGGGLLAGGRGLPDSLKPGAAAAASGAAAKNATPLDQLLAALENPGAVDIDDVQEAIVEQVQIGDRRALIGQKDALVRYVQHPNAEVRRTAVWALGRTDDLRLARHLLQSLGDSDLGVLVEARNALCWLSRKPRGLGETDGPYDGLPEDASAEQKQAALAKWHADLVQLWGKWYLDNRPYADRGDEFEAELRQKIGYN